MAGSIQFQWAIIRIIEVTKAVEAMVRLLFLPKARPKNMVAQPT
jgi:hypothetical protein